MHKFEKLTKKMAYINTPVKSVRFSLPYSDNSGERISVALVGNYATINDNGRSVDIDTDDIEWLIDVLKDIKSIVELNAKAKEQDPNA